MTPFSFSRPIVETTNKTNKVGYFRVRGNEDGTWSVRLGGEDAVGKQRSAMTDNPDDCFVSAITVLYEWFLEKEAVTKDAKAAVESWPDLRPGHRPDWKRRELGKIHQEHRRLAAAVNAVRLALQAEMRAAGWPAEIPTDA